MHSDDQPTDPHPDENHSAENEPTDPQPPPAPAGESTPPGAPRIVNETPIGGQPPRAPAARSPQPPAPADRPPADAATDELTATPEETPPASRGVPEESITPAPMSDDAPEPPPPDPALARDVPLSPGAEDAPPTEAENMPVPDHPPAPETPPTPEAPAAPASSPAPEAEPVTPSEAEPVASSQEWDDDISPELAAILFGGAAGQSSRSSHPSETPDREKAAPPTAETAPTVGAAAAPEPPPAARKSITAAAPIRLTDITQTPDLPITAQGVASPPPSTPLEGRRRYVRLEEPVSKEGGQHVKETWDYLEPERPTLEDRTVTQMQIEHFEYPDGSWKWTFRRQYADRGHDAREVRANADRTYIERDDTIKYRDASNQVVEHNESAALILAPPPQEEKRGFLSSLLGRDSETEGAPTWHEASANETRAARKDGGEAFDRGFFGGLF